MTLLSIVRGACRSPDASGGSFVWLVSVRTLLLC